MGVCYNSFLNNNRHITGICYEMYKDDLEGLKIDDLYMVKTLDESTKTLEDKSDIILFLPGSFGTLSELMYIVESKRTNIHDKDIIIFSDNTGNHLRLAEYDDFKNEYPNTNIDFINTNDIIHDRYIILDYKKKSERIYHCGASSKDAGKKATTITEINDKNVFHPLIDSLLTNSKLILNWS